MKQGLSNWAGLKDSTSTAEPKTQRAAQQAEHSDNLILEVFALPGPHAELMGSCLPTFRDNLSVPFHCQAVQKKRLYPINSQLCVTSNKIEELSVLNVPVIEIRH